ncbi:MAG: phosphate transport system permease protein [Solirubrobacteraceae bacterium]|jgi:phosphate transport system permease protein|nr:phosphate transport system permease protein [Solirubrobacteraceae bacterium]
MSDGVVLTRTGGPRAAGESAIKVALFLAAGLSVLTTTLIVLSLVRETVGFLGDVGIGDFLFGTKWTPQLAGDQQSFGAVPLVVGTLYLTFIGLLVAIPLGLLSAIYLAEYATPRVRKVVKPVLEVLAGVPTIVFGFFALTFVTPEILRGVFGLEVEQFNQLAAGIIVGILVLPTIASVAEDAMSAVPASLREGAFGLGANRMKVALRVVFPAALSGIVAALVLGASRAIGETLVILLAGGSGQLLPEVVWSPLDSGGSMASFIASTATGDAPTGSIEYETIFAVGFLLFVFTLVLNMVSIRLVNKFRQVYE